jgi:citrate synthase
MATLHFPGGTAQFPIMRGVDGHNSIDISTFMKQTGYTTLDHRLHQKRHHLYRR